MLLLEDKRPLQAKFHTAHLLRQQRLSKPRLSKPRPKPLLPWRTPVVEQIFVNRIRFIQRTVCEAYGISLDDMLGVGRTGRVAHPRQVAIYLIRTLTQLSLLEIGRRFHRDHSTVIHALRAIERQRQDNCGLDRRINNFKEFLA